ncbi:ABC transporter ATP-binding protein [Candidatus Saccharibacteria bacterium]|nr:ABC transporter ATP-binding protein [Candidatus Saccharibacteria bacterium]
MTKPEPLIEVKNVSKSFQTPGGAVEVLRNVNFEIPEGSFTIIYGPSGSGKSTLLNLLIGLDAPTSGKVTYAGKDLYAMDKNERAYFRAHTLGMVQQADHWVKSLNVLENVALPLYFSGLDSDKAREGAELSLKRVGMEPHAHKKPMVLSGGEQQRVAMARALVNHPTYITADEPTGNLDSHNGDQLIRLLKDLNVNYKRTIVLVTHNLEYLSVGDQLILIEDGVATETKNTDVSVITNRLLADTKKRIDGWRYDRKK